MGGKAQARPDAEAFLIKVLLFIDVIFIDATQAPIILKTSHSELSD